MPPAPVIAGGKGQRDFADCRRQKQTGKLAMKWENISEIRAVNSEFFFGFVSFKTFSNDTKIVSLEKKISLCHLKKNFK